MASGMATRCTACGTVFRVVPDQLRVSEGWVRCGRCSEVFNAAEALLDLDTGAARAPAAETPRSMVRFGGSRPADAPPPAMADFGLPPPRREPEAAPPSAAHAPHAAYAPEPEPMPTMDEAVSRFAPDAAEADDPLPPAEAAQAAQAELPLPEPDITAEPRTPPRPPAAATAATPSFLRQAERAARWRRPRVRAALAATVVLGLLGLVAQVGLAYRDLVAARFPALRPALVAACAPLGCSVGPAHVIDSLVVESSGLVRVEKSSVYRLSVALRNRAALEVALPALELSLTDSQGQLVARRVLATGELGLNQATLAAGRELQLQATLQAATAPVAGYTIELFYP
jgi:predicted Zn finger-like uncharacterized protein